MADDQAGPSHRDAAKGDQQIVKAERKQVAHQADDIKSMLQALAVQQHKDGIKEQYEFWETQPVAQFNEDPSKLPVLQVRRMLSTNESCLFSISNSACTAARGWSHRSSKNCERRAARTIPSTRKVCLLMCTVHKCFALNIPRK